MAVPFVRGHRTVPPWTPRNTCVYTRHPSQRHAMCGVLMWLPAKHAKNGMRVKTLADQPSQQKFAGLYGIRCKLVNIINFSGNKTKDSSIALIAL